MPVTVQFKDKTKYDGREYRQNERATLSEPTAARLVAMDVAEVAPGSKVSSGFTGLVETIREVRAKNRRPVPKAIREAAAEERREVSRRFRGLETARQF